MSIFAIYTNFVFQDKPDWLDDFKKKHNQVEYPYHVTLTQPRFVSEDQIREIKEKIASFLKGIKQIPIIFDTLDIDEKGTEENDGCILVLAHNDAVVKLQKALLNLLEEYKEYVVSKTIEYEENFRPHLTIADKLNKESFELAKKDIKENIVIHGVITQVTLVIVRNNDEREEVTFDL